MCLQCFRRCDATQTVQKLPHWGPASPYRSKSSPRSTNVFNAMHENSKFDDALLSSMRHTSFSLHRVTPSTSCCSLSQAMAASGLWMHMPRVGLAMPFEASLTSRDRAAVAWTTVLDSQRGHSMKLTCSISMTSAAAFAKFGKREPASPMSKAGAISRPKQSISSGVCLGASSFHRFLPAPHSSLTCHC